MKNITVLFMYLTLLIACNGGDNPEIAIQEPVSETPATEPTVGTAWNLVFEENFDTDLSKWNVWESGAFNNEVQLYQKEQASLENGILTITSQREEVTGATFPFDDTPKDFEYVSARMETLSMFGPSNAQGELEYRIMARIQLPKGNGMWPAFWSTSDPWPTNGEIDILEARGNQPMQFQSNLFYGPTANTPITRNEDTEIVHQVNTDLTEDFHVYELIWRSNSLEIRFDDQVIHTYTANAKNYVTEFFGKKHSIILNLAVGGFFFSDSDATNFADTATMKVDWVKVYKR
ncbi:MAG: glycoside hydrolase family 16 protein [Maribacter sp.]